MPPHEFTSADHTNSRFLCLHCKFYYLDECDSRTPCKTYQAVEAIRHDYHDEH